MVLRIDGLSKNYGPIKAVDKLSLNIEAGNVYGILGPNGSGKTTTLGLILGILKPSSGRFEWFDGKYGDNPRMKIGALLETPNFYPYLNAVDNLEIVRHIKRAPKSDFTGPLKLVNLYERRHSAFRTYSLGMKQRLAIAASMIGDPEVLIFDEPTNGLDPQGIAEVRDTLVAIARTGKTVIMASHILVEVEKICSHVAILQRGKLIASGTIGNILRDEVVLEVAAEDMERLENAIKIAPFTHEISQINHVFELHVDASTKAAEVNKWAFDQGIILTHLQIRKTRLEEEFLQLTKEQL
jgi:ABC-2 type transport system ATP-binding protein